MKKDIFETLDNYMKGYMGNNYLTQKDIDRYTGVIGEMKREILKDINKAPEIIHKWLQLAEIENIRLQMTQGERMHRSDSQLIAVQHIKMALTDSEPLGGAE